MEKRENGAHHVRLGCMAFAVSLALGACGGEPAGPENQLSDVARDYFEHVLDLMQQHSIKRFEINWPDFRADAYRRLGPTQTTADTYDAIRYAIEQIGDGHSLFRPPEGGSDFASVAGSSPVSDHLEGGVGYLTVTAYSGTGPLADALVDTYHSLIEGVDTTGVCGWVVDIRGNWGGNMWPMIAGVGPVLGSGTLGFFIHPDSVVETWTYEDGASRLNGFTLAQAAVPYVASSADKPVAVLTNGQTASSGEAVAVAFRGRSGTRSFGTQTAGLSTANRGFFLSDGALLLLTTSTMADRTGRIYGQELHPDSSVAGTQTGDPATDPQLAAGADWVRTQAACSGPG